MAAKKRAKAAPAAPAIALNNQDVHVLSHTARIVAVLDRAPGHGRRDEYSRQITIYRGRWAEFSPEKRKAIGAFVVDHIPDLDKAAVAAAISSLEG